MTVKELIEILKEMPEDMEVYIKYFSVIRAKDLSRPISICEEEKAINPYTNEELKAVVIG